MKNTARVMSSVFAMAIGLLVTGPALGSQPLDACTVLTADEIRAALGRNELGTATPGRATGGHSDCRFPGFGTSDVRITLTPEMASAKDDFALQPELLAAEDKSFEKVSGFGDGAYYWSDSVQFRVGERITSLWIIRTPRTESPASVQVALTRLAGRAAERLRAGR